MDNIHGGYGEGGNYTEVLHGISGTVAAGGITGLVGPDGAGKTTLIRILAGILRPASGSVRIFGNSISKMGQTGNIGYMPQRFGLYEDISVEANLELYAHLAGVQTNEKEALFNKLLRFTNLAPFTTRLAGRLSGGMKQKLGIACALLGKPKLLLLDEPGVGVDPLSRRELWNMVLDLASGGMTVLWSTSYMDEAERCPNLIMLEKGAVLFAGKPGEMEKRMSGHVFLLRCKKGSSGMEHRQELAEWSTRQGVVDALIQGEFIRLAISPQAGNSTLKSIEQSGGAPTEPLLEDAYMEAIGGIDQSPSPYASIKLQRRTGKAIIADDLTRKFGTFVAARNVTFTVNSGEVFGLLGPNGAGKSTTFRMLCGLLKPTSGHCSVDGVDMISAGSQAREHIGYMAQNFSLYPEITVRQNISIFADLYSVSRQTRLNLLPMLVSALELEAFLDKKAGDMPRGLKQRLALLCATMHEPAVLFLDEPTSGVDVRARREFWKHISALTASGVAVMVTTHFMEEAEYCDNIALLYRGSIIHKGSPDQLKALVKNQENPTLEDAFVESIEAYDRDHPV